MQIIGILLWVSMAFSLIIEYAPMCQDLNIAQLFAVATIFMVGAPAFVIVNMLSSILDIIVSTGTNGDDSEGEGDGDDVFKEY